jgi:hypothetical protein
LADNDRLIIREHPEGPVIAEHTIDHRRGQLIQDRQHKRDRTKGIDAYLGGIAGKFEQPEEAASFLEQIQRLYPRYIRDQLQIISQEMNKVNTLVFNEALSICLQKKLFSANDFRDVIQFLNKQYGDDRTETTGTEIQPLHSIHQSILKAKPEKRDMSEYVSILKGATG